MIKLQKQTCPSILNQNKDKWTNELLSYYQQGVKPPDSITGRYRHQEIKEAVKSDSFDKCIYCESKISQIYFGDIEHIKPKSKYPRLTFDWENLGFVCAKCNNAKSDDFDDTLPPVNPYNDNPSDFIIALGEIIFGICGNGRGQVTEKLLKLNRSELIEMRRERIKYIKDLADNYQKETNTLLKKLLLNELKEELKPNKPYSMVCNCFISNYLKI